MKLKDIKDVLTYAAFRPEPDDSTAPWTKRFPKQRTLFLNVGRSEISWISTDRNGAFLEGGDLGGDIKEIAQEMSDDWKGLTDDGWCGISINNRFMISLETNLTRKKGSEVLIRTSPKAALGAKAEKGKRYAVEHNPESNSSVLLAVDEDMVTSIESAFSQSGLKIGRISCGVFAMLQDCIDQVTAAREQFKETNPDQSLGKIISVVCCGGSFCAMTQSDEQWVELRSRSNLYKADDLEPITKILQPLVEHAGDGSQILFMADEAGTGVAEYLQNAMPNVRVSDVTQPNQLWKILREQ